MVPFDYTYIISKIKRYVKYFVFMPYPYLKSILCDL